MRFENRHEAGKLLAEKLQPWASFRPLVLGLPRGGVPVANEVAQSLRADLDILLVKKIGAPGHAEFALGAIAEGGDPIWNKNSVNYMQLSEPELRNLAEQKRQELESQAITLRGHRDPISSKDRAVILVDDGLATGSTMTAAIPDDFWAIGIWYRDFSQVSDEEVREILFQAPTSSTNW